MNIRFATPQDMGAIIALRFEVFVDEQRVPPEEELDEHDRTARHIIAEEDGIPVGCARLIEDGDGTHIGRLAVKKAYRGMGIGRDICRFIIEDCRARGCESIWLNGQTQAQPFYEKLGFVAVSGLFWEAGIEHRRMEMRL